MCDDVQRVTCIVSTSVTQNIESDDDAKARPSAPSSSSSKAKSGAPPPTALDDDDDARLHPALQVMCEV